MYVGYGPPYTAVVTLSVMAGQHWRTIRTRLLNNGIPDPMALTSLHAMLDAVEDLVVQAMISDCVKAEEARAKRAKFLNALYAPTGETALRLNGDGYKPTPAGFDTPEDVENAFDAFAAMTR